MKKLFVIPLLLLYITAVSGVMINLHYCGQALESWSLYADESGCTDDGCGDESDENDGCCKDEVIVVKVNQDQDAPTIFKLKQTTFIPDAIMPYMVFVEKSNVADTHTSIANTTHAPPGLWQSIPLYKLHSSLTYYG
ncbi:MAG: hypothetical protein H6551_04865 [Chitinophagales bacterium]|nr:hypothetical protein [Chitinophagaceae bacterium]MCB9064458.1 hypothetical protein [Chitinophagales bacterium]